MGHARLPPGRGRARGRFALQVFCFVLFSLGIGFKEM